ncbi:MAG: hypothetical protein IT380_07050 [Myxococcales bacterium]|nr:hypothetical protein [Myxococcales bacterium]
MKRLILASRAERLVFVAALFVALGLLLLNSFADSCKAGSGDECTGVAASPSFVPTPATWLEFWVGGGRAEGADTQVGVRLVETLPSGQRRVRYVASGERDETMRRVLLDLGWLAGRTIAIEIFDEATGAWGHVLAGGVTLYESEPVAEPPADAGITMKPDPTDGGVSPASVGRHP